MNYVDILLLIILGYFIYKGFRIGFVRIIGGFLGIVAGAYLAGRYYDVAAIFLIDRFASLSWTTALVLGFIGIFIVVNLIVGALVSIITAVFHIIPLATTVNRVIGALLGALQGLLIIGLIIWISTLIPIRNDFVDEMRESQVAHYAEGSAQLVQPLLPEGLRNLNYEKLQELQDLSEEKAEYLKQHIPPRFFERIQKEREDFEGRIQQELDASDAGAAASNAT